MGATEVTDGSAIGVSLGSSDVDLVGLLGFRARGGGLDRDRDGRIDDGGTQRQSVAFAGDLGDGAVAVFVGSAALVGGGVGRRGLRRALAKFCRHLVVCDFYRFGDRGSPDRGLVDRATVSVVVVVGPGERLGLVRRCTPGGVSQRLVWHRGERFCERDGQDRRDDVGVCDRDRLGDAGDDARLKRKFREFG